MRCKRVVRIDHRVIVCELNSGIPLRFLASTRGCNAPRSKIPCRASRGRAA